ncbi:MAG: hypothetical protein GY788_09065 [bacterium]|nr:hypothetical protein [bacterium]
MRCILTALILILAACSSPETEDSPTTSTTVPAAATTTTSTTVAPTPPPVTTPPTTTTTSAPEPTPSSPALTPLPLPVEELPHTIDNMTLTGAGLLYAGNVSPTPRDHPNEGALWHYNGVDWVRTVIADIAPPEEFGSHPQITNLVVWEGGYLGFIQPDWISEDTAPALPSVLKSADGRTWTTEPLFHRTTAGSPLTGVLPTPESPPWPGAAGISAVTTTEDEIIAVGWIVTAPGESTATVWRSSDTAT